mgnify:CR=1 FL=1
MISFFGRVGGKHYSSKTIIQYIDEETSKNIYVEPFCGASAVFFKKGYESKVEVLNDKDEDIINIFKDIREVDNLNDCDFTPIREVFNIFKEQVEFKSKKERLYRNLYLSKTSFRSDRNCFIGEKNCLLEKHIKTGRNLKKEGYLKKYGDRLKKVNLYSQDYKDIIKKYDTEKTFFYLDPPYSQAHKQKDYKITGVSPKEIYDVVCNIKGKFLLSYDKTTSNIELFKKFNIIDLDVIYSTPKIKNKKLKEILISNYKI